MEKKTYLKLVCIGAVVLMTSIIFLGNAVADYPHDLVFIDGRVFDREGNAVRHCTVHLYEYYFNQKHTLGYADTDGRGYYYLQNVPLNWYTTVYAEVGLGSDHVSAYYGGWQSLTLPNLIARKYQAPDWPEIHNPAIPEV